VYLTLTGIDIDIDLDAEIKLFYHLIPVSIKPTKIAFTGVTFDIMLESTADDNVHWKLAQSTHITIDDYKLTLSSPILNSMVNIFHSAIKSIINS